MMSNRAYHLENHPFHYPSDKLTQENYGVSHACSWPLKLDRQDEDEYFYYLLSPWKIIGVCKPPFDSKITADRKAFVVQNTETGLIYWWHFEPGTMVILPIKLS